jgi:hypothetical protein
VTDDELLAAVAAVLDRSAALYGELGPLVGRSDADPARLDQLRSEIEAATADWYRVNVRFVWGGTDPDRRADLQRLSPSDRANLEAFFAERNAQGSN